MGPGSPGTVLCPYVLRVVFSSVVGACCTSSTCTLNREHEGFGGLHAEANADFRCSQYAPSGAVTSVLIECAHTLLLLTFQMTSASVSTPTS